MADSELAGSASVPTVETPADPPKRSGFYVRRWVLVVVGLVIAAAVAIAVGFAVADGGGDGHGREGARRFGGEFRGGDHGGHHVLGVVVVLVLVALVVAAFVLLARRYRDRSTDVTTNAERTLADRFARGEIDESDYLSRRDALRS